MFLPSLPGAPSSDWHRVRKRWVGLAQHTLGTGGGVSQVVVLLLGLSLVGLPLVGFLLVGAVAVGGCTGSVADRGGGMQGRAGK